MKTIQDSIKNYTAAIIFLASFCLLLGLLIGSFFHSIHSEAATSSFQLQQVNLVSSVENNAKNIDKNLTDAWGLEFGHTGRVWLTTSSGFSPVYDGTGNIVHTKDRNGESVPLAVKIPTPPEIVNEPAPLTGMVFSDANSFSGDSFIFVTEQGTIAGWQKEADGFEPLDATMRVDNSKNGAVYKGATSANTSSGWQLYVANFGQNSVDVFNTTYEVVKTTGGFKDQRMPKDFAPFNIKEIQGKLFVTYAKQSIDKGNDVKGLGNGYINVFDTDGKLLQRLVSNGELNSPWGIALAPANFGAFSNYLLVGNFGDGHILVFDPTDGKLLGSVNDENNQPLQIDGLWALTFGTDNGAGKKNELFFASGPSAEDQGIFGKLQLRN